MTTAPRFISFIPTLSPPCLTRFAQGLAEEATQDGVGSIDGRGLTAAFERARGGSPLAIVSAFATGSGLVLGQIGVPQGTGEIAALRGLLELLDLKGRIVTADAIHCQKETAQAVLDKGADYVLALKPNRFTTYDDAMMFLDDWAVRLMMRPRRSTPTTVAPRRGAWPRGASPCECCPRRASDRR